MADVLKVVVDVESKGAQAGAKKAADSVAGLGKALKVAGALGIGFGSGMAIARAAIDGLKSAVIAVPRAFYDAVAATAAYGDEVAEAARAAGVGAEALQELRYSIELGGASVQDLQGALRRLSVSMVEAQEGKAAAATFERLGVAVEGAGGRLRATEDVFYDLADAIQRQGEGARTAADLNDLLGKSGTRLTSTLLGGSDALQEQADRLRSLGGVLSDEALVGAELFQDSLAELRIVGQGLTRDLGSRLLPTALGMTQALADLAAGARDTAAGLRDVSGGLIDVESGMDAAGQASTVLWSLLTPTAMMLGEITDLLQERGRRSILEDIKDGAKVAGDATRQAAEDAIGPAKDESRALSEISHRLQEQERISRSVADATRDRAEAAAEAARLERQAVEERTRNEVETAALLQGQADTKAAAQREQEALYLDSVERTKQATVDAWNEMTAAAQRYKEEGLAATRSSLDAVAWAVGAVGDAITAMYGSNVREASTSAKIIFGIQQALALASATVAMFEAIAKANASAPTPQNIPAIASAAIIGGAQIAGIVATTIAGAVADAGLTPDMVKRATRGGYTTVIAQSGEAVVDRDGTREISRMLAIQRTQMETAARWRSGQDRGLGSLRLEVDGRVLGEVVDERRVRSQERGIPAEDARRF